MNLKGQRKSKNFEDIRKQEPSMALTVTAKQGPAGLVNNVDMTSSQVSKKAYPKGKFKDLSGSSIATKSGAPSLEGAAQRDAKKNENYNNRQKEQQRLGNEIDDLLKDLAKPKNKSAGGIPPEKQSKATNLAGGPFPVPYKK